MRTIFHECISVDSEILKARQGGNVNGTDEGIIINAIAATIERLYKVAAWRILEENRNFTDLAVKIDTDVNVWDIKVKLEMYECAS